MYSVCPSGCSTVSCTQTTYMSSIQRGHNQFVRTTCSAVSRQPRKNSTLPSPRQCLHPPKDTWHCSAAALVLTPIISAPCRQVNGSYRLDRTASSVLEPSDLGSFEENSVPVSRGYREYDNRQTESTADISRHIERRDRGGTYCHRTGVKRTTEYHSVV